LDLANPLPRRGCILEDTVAFLDQILGPRR